jgi:hypothetical protein
MSSGTPQALPFTDVPPIGSAASRQLQLRQPYYNEKLWKNQPKSAARCVCANYHWKNQQNDEMVLVFHALALLGLVRHLHPMRRHGNHGGLGVGITHLTRKSEVLLCLAPVLFRIHWFDFASFNPHDDAQVSEAIDR